MAQSFPWTTFYPEGVPAEIGPLEFPSLTALFESSAARFSDRVAFENMGVKLTFGETDRLASAFAAYLQKQLGLRAGERIAIQMPNLLQFPIAFIGALKAGLIVVNTN
ncbi:MAG: AMP-binding protein, partial [Bacteroidota bacterium]